MTLRTKPDTGTAHTPGPWKVVPATNRGRVLFHTVDPADNGKWRGSVASVHSAENIDGISVEERDANALLIAAAPMMRVAMDVLGFGGDRADEKIGWRGNYPQPSSNSHFRCEFCAAEHKDCTEIPHAKYCPVTICRAASEGWS